MANTRRAHDEAWTNAKKICRLNARQVEMARALAMNPSKSVAIRAGSWSESHSYVTAKD